MEPRIAKCIKLAGSAPAGVLLYRMIWWHAPPKVLRNGELWMVNPREKWMTDTGLSAWQYRQAMADLQKRKLIAVGRHLFKCKGDEVQKTYPLVRLLPTALEGLLPTWSGGCSPDL